MKRFGSILLTLPLILLLPALPAAGQQVDLSGAWTLQASGFLPDLNDPCEFEGGGTMTQVGSQISGQASLTLVAGPADCPAEMMADLMGTIDGSSFGGTLDGGLMFGVLDFVGDIGAETLSISGSFAVQDGGPFAGTTGTWVSGMQPLVAIPTLGVLALIALAALLAVGSLFALRRLRQQQAPA